MHQDSFRTQFSADVTPANMPEKVISAGSFEKAALSANEKEKINKNKTLNQNFGGDYMFVEMAHNTDDDTVVLICVSNSDKFQVHEYKLEKVKDKNWQFII